MIQARNFSQRSDRSSFFHAEMTVPTCKPVGRYPCCRGGRTRRLCLGGIGRKHRYLRRFALQLPLTFRCLRKAMGLEPFGRRRQLLLLRSLARMAPETGRHPKLRSCTSLSQRCGVGNGGLG